jgi:hypothetical protein
MEEDEVETCELCNGPLMLLGILGNRIHLQCRNCGMQFSKEQENENEEDCDD